MKNRAFIFTTLFFCSCISKIQEPQEDYFVITDFQVDYNQLTKEIYFQVVTNVNSDTIRNVSVEILGTFPLIEMSFSLNDSANNGDLISINGIYSGLYNSIELSFQDYVLQAVVENNLGIIKNKSISFKVEQESPPQIYDIKFWKKYSDGSGYEFNPDNEPFQVNDSTYSYLYFQAIAKDENGLDDIAYIRYQVNVESMAPEVDDCEYLPESGYQNYAQWYLEYQYSTDSTFVYDVNNAYLDNEQGISIEPISLCGKTGVSFFKFIISDLIFDPVIKEVAIPFAKCGDNVWNCEEDCEHCPMECGECVE